MNARWALAFASMLKYSFSKFKLYPKSTLWATIFGESLILIMSVLFCCGTVYVKRNMFLLTGLTFLALHFSYIYLVIPSIFFVFCRSIYLVIQTVFLWILLSPSKNWSTDMNNTSFYFNAISLSQVKFYHCPWMINASMRFINTYGMVVSFSYYTNITCWIIESVVYTPTFVELSTKDRETNKQRLHEAEVKYPFGEYISVN